MKQRSAAAPRRKEMPTKDKNPNPTEVKKQLEAIAGQEIDAAPEQIISLWFPVGAHDYNSGTVLWRSAILPGRNCVSSSLLDASGASSTGAAGNRVFLLSDFICLPQVRSLAEPINVVATARSTAPFYVTVTHTLVNNATDVQITVFAWDAKGNPAPNVTFDWRCRLVSNPIIG
jgi:hypothetical protein